MAIIDSIRMMFTSDVSGLEQGARRAKAIVKDLGQDVRSTFGKDSLIGDIASMLKGGGALFGLTVLGNVLQKSATQFESSTKSGKGFIDSMTSSLPVFGKLKKSVEGVVQGFVNLQMNAIAAESAVRSFNNSAWQRVTEIGDAFSAMKDAKTVEEFDKAIEGIGQLGRGQEELLRTLRNRIVDQEKLNNRLKEEEETYGQIRKHMASLRNEAADMGRNAGLKAYWDVLRIPGSTMDEAREAMQITDDMEAFRELQNEMEAFDTSMKSIADTVKRSNPVTKFNQDVDDLTDALHYGVITMDEYLSQLTQLQNEFIDVDGAISTLENSIRSRPGARRGGPTGAKTFGSQEAYVAMATNSVNQRAMDEAKKQTEILKRQLQELRRLRDELGSNAEVVVDIP